MTRQSWKIPLFYKYLLSYVTILFVPIIVMGITVQLHFIGLLKQQSFDSNQNMLLQVSDIVETKYREFIHIAGIISEYPDLFDYSWNDVVLNMHLINELNFSAGNEYIDQTLLYRFDSPYMISNKSTYSVSLFNQLYPLNGTDRPPTEAIAALRTPTLLTSGTTDETKPENASKQFIYAVPLPLNSDHPQGIILFIMKESRFRDLLKSAVTYPNSNSFILDRNGRLLTSISALRPVDRFILKQMENTHVVYSANGTKDIPLNHAPGQGDGQNISELTWNKDRYFASNVTSPYSGWTYVTVVSNAELMAQPNAIRNRAMEIVALITGVGLLLIFVAMKVNYNPLHRLIRYTEKRWEKEWNLTGGIDAIRMVIDHAEDVNNRMKKQVNMARPALRQHLLTELLKGKYEDRELFNEAGQEIGLVLEGDEYQVAVVEYQNRKQGRDPEAVPSHQRLQELLPPSTELYTVDLLDGKQQAWILSAAASVRLAEEEWNSVHRALSAISASQATIGVGKAYNRLELISKSLIEASSALHYSVVAGKNRVILFEATPSERTEEPWYPEKELIALRNHLLKSETAEASELIEDLVEQISRNSPTMFMATCLCFEVVQTIWKTAQAMLGSRYLAASPPNILELTRLESFDELGQFVLTMTRQVCLELEAESVHSDDDLYRAILEDIQANALHYDFSVQSMAERMSWSASHIRKLFKEHAGMTISDYVNELRMKRAKELLATTETPLQNIVQQLGYSDVSSFIRKFKQETMMTPGEYRRIESTH